MIGTKDAERIDTVEQAKLIREALKRNFPGSKFSVRIDRYSGGSSVDIRWTDGPTESMVEDITNPYRGGGFDGMIDLAYSQSAWLLPDGTVRFAGTSGTEASRGSVPASFGSPMHPGARLVRFSGQYIGISRRISPEFQARCLEKVRDELGHYIELEDRVPDFHYKGRSFPYPNPSGHDMVAFVARRTATKPSDWVAEWEKPKARKPKGEKPAVKAMVRMSGIEAHGMLHGYVTAHSGRAHTRAKSLGFFYDPRTRSVSFHGGVSPKYVREAVAVVLTWATGDTITA